MIDLRPINNIITANIISPIYTIYPVVVDVDS
jgi:hypothetical protein